MDAMRVNGNDSNGGPLRTLTAIQIQFNPCTWIDIETICIGSDPSTDRENWPAWPWKHEEETAKALDQLGVKMEYTPRMSKRDWFCELEEECWEYRQSLAKQTTTFDPMSIPTTTVSDCELRMSPPLEKSRVIQRYFKSVEWTTEERLESSRAGYQV